MKKFQAAAKSKISTLQERSISSENIDREDPVKLQAFVSFAIVIIKITVTNSDPIESRKPPSGYL